MFPFAVLLLGNPDTSRVLVVENVKSPASIAVASDYSKRRGVRNVLKVACQDSTESVEKETILYDDFAKAIEPPLRSFLKKHPEIDFIVMTKGVPIRIRGTKDIGMSGFIPSLDSYVASIDYPERKDAVKVNFAEGGWFSGKAYANRYWASQERFSHVKFGGYLVTRLDGYTVDDAKALVTRSLEAEKVRPTGNVLLDMRSAGTSRGAAVPKNVVNVDGKGEVRLDDLGYDEWDTDLAVAANVLGRREVPVTLDATATFVANATGLMGYASWGSNDPKYSKESYLSLRFAPGAILETAVSTSARTFIHTNEGQSLIADLLANGATGAKGYVNEPLLTAVASPTVLFDRYTRGWTLAESYYAASRFLGWEDLVVGDPLCAPYSRR